jgi:hypothetical protein
MAEKRRKPPSLVAGQQRRRNRTYGNKWRKVREQVLARDGHLCQIRVPGVCRGRADQVDHVVKARWTGPVFDPAKLRSCCRACNNWVAHHEEPRLRARTGSASRFPPKVFGDGGCPHRALDGSGDWCVGSGEVGHWTQWYIGSPSAPWWAEGLGPDDQPRAPGGGIA